MSSRCRSENDRREGRYLDLTFVHLEIIVLLHGVVESSVAHYSPNKRKDVDSF